MPFLLLYEGVYMSLFLFTILEAVAFAVSTAVVLYVRLVHRVVFVTDCTVCPENLKIFDKIDA